MTTPTAGRLILLALVGAILSGMTGGPARAHDFFLIPESSRPGVDVPFSLALHVTDTFPGDPVAWRPDRTSAFFLVDRHGRRSLLKSPVQGEPTTARVSLRDGGATLIVLQSVPSLIELSSDDFESYVGHEGHESILKARKATPAAREMERERYTRFVKTLVGGSGDRAVISRSVGLPIEIVPEVDPVALGPGDRLPVRVEFEGAPYDGGYLCATHAGFSDEHDAYAWCGRLDDRGRTEVPIRAPGWQLVRITRMRSLQGDEEADWESFWAALTFEVAAP